MRIFNGRPRIRTSAIVTCRNYGRYLAQCLESLERQTLPFDEILLVDDASCDETPEVWEKNFRKTVRYERVDFASAMAARHHGVQKCRGDFFVCVDGDDWLAPQYHEKMIRPFSKDPKLGLVYCGLNIVREGGPQEWFEPEYHPMTPFDPYRLWVSNFLINASLFRREAWQGGKRAFGIRLPEGQDFIEDWDHNLELVREGWTAALVEERLVFYRVHGKNYSRRVEQNTELRNKYYWEIRKRYLPRELSVIVTIAEKGPYLHSFFQSLERLEKPEKTEIILVDGSGDSRGYAGMKRFASHYLASPFSGKDADYADWKAFALEKARRLASGKNILLLEGEISLPPGSYRQLKEGKEITGARLYSARIPSNTMESAAAWRPVRGDPGLGLYSIPVLKKPRRVFAAGSHALLADAEIFHKIPFGDLGTLYAGLKAFEFRLGKWMLDHGHRWFVDGKVYARRRNSQEFSVSVGKGHPNPSNASDRCPQVSIVISANDKIRNPDLLLKSLRKLNYPKNRLEILAIRNPSEEKAAAQAARFPEVKFFGAAGENSVTVINRGIRESNGELIAFINTDCTVEPDWLTKLSEPFLKNPILGAICEAVSYEKPARARQRPEAGHECLPKQSGALGSPATSNILFRRVVFDEIGFFEKTWGPAGFVELFWRMKKESFWDYCELSDGNAVLREAKGGFFRACRYFILAGRIHHALFRKSPGLLPFSYYWLPQTRRELLLQFFKHLLPGSPIVYRWGSGITAFRERGLLSLRSLLHQWEYLGAARRDRANNSPADRYLVFIGRTLLNPGNSRHWEFWDIANRGISVLHVGGETGLLRSWYEVLLSLAGGTAAWSWLPNLLSLNRWKLFPVIGAANLAREWNRNANVRRIKKHFPIARNAKILLVSNGSKNDLDIWAREMRKSCASVHSAMAASGDSFISPESCRSIVENWLAGLETEEIIPQVKNSAGSEQKAEDFLVTNRSS